MFAYVHLEGVLSWPHVLEYCTCVCQLHFIPKWCILWFLVCMPMHFAKEKEYWISSWIRTRIIVLGPLNVLNCIANIQRLKKAFQDCWYSIARHSLINCHANMFHYSVLTGHCGDIRKMIVMLEEWSNMKNIHCLVVTCREIPNSVTQGSNYKAFSVTFIIV